MMETKAIKYSKTTTNNFSKHIISIDDSIRAALAKLDQLALDALLFLVNDEGQVIGSLTDGDIRRGLIKGLGLEDNLTAFSQPNPKCLRKNAFSLEQMQEWRANNYRIIPVLDDNDCIVEIINFRIQKSYLPVSAVIMAGGKGTRLRPLTLDTPKPLLKIGGKPIMEYNVDRLKAYGINDLTVSINYLGEQLIEYFGDGAAKEMEIKYVEESEPLGTIGAVSMIDKFKNDYVLVMNSDLLTNIDYEDMFQTMLEKDGDMIIATTPYEVEIPYGVLETDGDSILALKEKPTYTYYSNAGIYIFKKEFIDLIPKRTHFNATDFMEELIRRNKKVLHYAIIGYWLDIGKKFDFEKAQRDIEHIQF